ncbi:MAG: cyclodeaminase/cyclohydrolase family protein [Chloroflexi bacterium]|nr:cyclodeaminase/cyclohydrolase family protein [Chloroflexota bacterium]
MPLATKPLSEFLAELASVEPIPGGGSVAALGGALGASLVAMVCRLTIGRKGYEAAFAELEQILPRADALQVELRDYMQVDVDAYGRVMEAYRLPKDTEDQRTERTRAVQEALKHASDVPLHVAESCAEVLSLARVAVEKGNKNAASDAGVGALMAEAGLRGAAFNVSINLAAIKDAEYVADRQARVARLIQAADQSHRETLGVVQKRM